MARQPTIVCPIPKLRGKKVLLSIFTLFMERESEIVCSDLFRTGYTTWKARK
jgi:hypothetical protein